MLSATAQRRQQQSDIRALRGVPAFIYILKNTGLKEGLIHIGVSRRGGWAKALELNRDKNNVIPGSFECVFEVRAQDCGRAFESILEMLGHARLGRGGSDYFEIDAESAQHLIARCVEDANQRFQHSFEQELAHREYRHEFLSADEISEHADVRQEGKIIREGIFKKAMSWLT
jgi:hypothetical protein